VQQAPASDVQPVQLERPNSLTEVAEPTPRPERIGHDYSNEFPKVEVASRRVTSAGTERSAAGIANENFDNIKLHEEVLLLLPFLLLFREDGICIRSNRVRRLHDPNYSEGFHASIEALANLKRVLSCLSTLQDIMGKHFVFLIAVVVAAHFSKKCNEVLLSAS